MPYSTLADLKNQLSEDQLIQLTDDENLGVVNQAVIDKAIVDADAEIDSYLAGRYTVPLSPIPPLVARFSADLAIYNLYSRRMAVPDQRKDRRDNGVRLLKMLADRKTTLGETPQRAQDQAGGAKASGADRRITGKKGTTGGTLDNF